MIAHQDNYWEGICSRSFPDSFTEIKQYVDILINRGIALGLMGPREVSRIWDRHILNCLAIADLLPDNGSLADVGSGAGLPGIPLALVKTDLEVTLIESLLRRSNFLQDTVNELGISDRVKVLRDRAEEIADKYDVVVCRAVAPLEKLIKLTHKLIGPSGRIIALKGESAEKEIFEAGVTLEKLGLEAKLIHVRALPEAEVTYAIIIELK